MRGSEKRRLKSYFYDHVHCETQDSNLTENLCTLCEGIIGPFSDHTTQLIIGANCAKQILNAFANFDSMKTLLKQQKESLPKPDNPQFYRLFSSEIESFNQLYDCYARGDYEQVQRLNRAMKVSQKLLTQFQQHLKSQQQKASASSVVPNRKKVAFFDQDKQTQLPKTDDPKKSSNQPNS